jgi:anti-anti-sigma regulatory factor/HAMP domain-containing protein
MTHVEPPAASQSAIGSRLSLRARLILTLVGMALLAVSTVGIASLAVSRDVLTRAVGAQLDALAEEEATLIGQHLDQQMVALRMLALNQSLIAGVFAANSGYPPGQEQIQKLLDDLDATWIAADDDDILVRSRIDEAQVASVLRAYRDLDPENVELIVADAYGGLTAAAERTSDYDQSDEVWWQTARAGRNFISQPEFDASTNLTAILIAVPIVNRIDGAVVGVVRTTYRLEALAAKLDALRVGETDATALLLGDDALLEQGEGIGAISAEERTLFASAAGKQYIVAPFRGRERMLSVAPISAPRELAELGWSVALFQDAEEVLAPITAARNTQLLVALAVLASAVAVATVVAARVSAPLRRLAKAAESLAEGDLGRRVGDHGVDELGRLAQSFDSMASALEQRARSEQASQAEQLRLQDEVIRVQRDTLKELATPLIPLRGDVLLLPLIGSIDQARASEIHDALLQGAAKHRARRVILDLTGIPNLDVQVAQELMRAAQGVRLLGAEVVFTGISAALAHTLVKLDLSFEQLEVHSNLESALRV